MLTNQSSPVTPAIYVRAEKGFLYVRIRVNNEICNTCTFFLINFTKQE